MSGRKPKPLRLKLIEGNPGRRHLNLNEPTPDPEIPSCPDHLGAIAKAEWNRITPCLMLLGLLSEIDRAALAAYCMCWQRWVEAEQELKKSGTMIPGPMGYKIRNPHLRIATEAIKDMRAFLIEFGMTPSSRSRLSGAPKLPDDDETRKADKFFGKKSPVLQ